MDTNKIRNIILIVVGSISLVVILVAVGVRATMLGKNIVNFINGQEITVDSGSGNEEVKEYNNLDSFDSIRIDMNAGDINFYEGDFKVVTEFEEKTAPTVEVKNGTLTITSPKKINVYTGINFAPKNRVDIYIPAGTELKNVEMNVNAGDLEVASLQAKSVTIDVDAGDMTLSDSSISELNIDADAGDLDVENCAIETMEIEADAGDIDIMKSSIGYLQVDVDAGDLELKKTAVGEADIEASAGEVSFDGDFDKLKIDCSMGEVSVTAENIAGKSMEITTSLGEVKINGVDQGHTYRQ